MFVTPLAMFAVLNVKLHTTTAMLVTLPVTQHGKIKTTSNKSVDTLAQSLMNTIMLAIPSATFAVLNAQPNIHGAVNAIQCVTPAASTAQHPNMLGKPPVMTNVTFAD
jgi:hypothetical protein